MHCCSDVKRCYCLCGILVTHKAANVSIRTVDRKRQIKRHFPQPCDARCVLQTLRCTLTSRRMSSQGPASPPLLLVETLRWSTHFLQLVGERKSLRAHSCTRMGTLSGINARVSRRGRAVLALCWRRSQETSLHPRTSRNERGAHESAWRAYMRRASGAASRGLGEWQ
jgi:hypothetical protein